MNRKTVFSLGGFALLLALVLATREKEVKVGIPRLQLPALGEVDRIALGGTKGGELKRAGGLWTVSGRPADQTQVKQLVEALPGFKVHEFVTDKAEKHAELEVDAQKGTRVSVAGSTGKWELWFGKAAAGGGNYVRAEGQNAVFITNSPVGWQVKRGAPAFRERAIKTAAVADLKRVTFKKNEHSLTLVAAAGGGLALEPAPAAPYRFDAAAARRLLEQLASLRAQDFLDEPFGEATGTVTAELQNGQALTLEVGAARPDGTAPVRVSDDPQVYLLPRWTLESLFKTSEDLRDTTLLAFEPQKVQRVTLVAGGKKTVLAKEGEGWKLIEPLAPPPGFELDPSSVAATLERWRALRGARVVDPVDEKKAGLSKPTAQLEVLLEGGAKQSLRLGSELPSKERYVKGSADSLLYAIGAQERGALEQGLELFNRRSPPQPAAMRGLDSLPPGLREQLEAQRRQGPVGN